MYFKNEDIRWWFGFVEQNIEVNRVKVRVMSVTNMNPDEVPTENLRDATIAMGTGTSGTNGLGESPAHLWEGSCVVGIALDKAFTRLVILHTITSPDEICAVALGKEDVLTQFIKDNAAKSTGSGTSFSEPVTDHTKVKYPYNKATVTRSGHLLETDDTPNAERLMWAHRTGSYSLMNYDGDYIQKATKDFMQFVNNDFNTLILGNSRMVVKGSKSERVTGVTYYASPTWELNANNILMTAGKIEMHASVTITANLNVVGSLKVASLEAGSIKCNTLSCASMIDGAIPFAAQAGSLGGSAKFGDGAGSPEQATLSSTGGKNTDGSGVPDINPLNNAPQRVWDTVLSKYGPLTKVLKRAFKNRSDVE